jgi:hypothetical protein
MIKCNSRGLRERTSSLTDAQAAEVRRRLADPFPDVPLDDVRKRYGVVIR